MSFENINIRIATQFDGSGAAAAQQGFRNVTKAADELINSIKLGIGLDLGGRIVQQVSRIPAILQSAVARGVAFNRTIADSETAIAQMVQRFAGMDAVAAKQEAAKAIAKIKEVEPEAAGSLQDLVRGFLSVYGAAAKTGAPIESMVELVGRAANALSNLNLPAEQLSSELRMILSGNITQDSALGKMLGVTAEQIAQWTTARTLVQEITTRLGSLGSAGDTAAVRMSSLGSAIDQALGKLAEPVTKALDQAIVELTNDIKKLPEAELKRFGSDLATLVSAGAALTSWLMKHPALILNIATAVGTLGAAWTAVKLTELIAALGMKAVKLIATTGALNAETAALAGNTAAWNANAAASGRAAAARGFSLGSGAGGALRVGAMTTTAAAIGLAVKTTIDSFTEDQNSEADMQEASTRAKMQASRKFGRPGMKAAPTRASRPARVLTGEEPIDLLTGDPDLAKMRTEALGAGLGSDEEWAAKMARAEELRGLLGTTLGLGKGFNAEQAVAAIESSGTETQQREVLEIAKELFGLEKDIAAMQEQNAESSRESADEAQRRADTRTRELADLQLERQILTAQLNGDERRTIELQAQKTERQLLKQLLDADVPKDKAAEEAGRTAQLQKQVALRQQDAQARQALDNLKPSIGAEATEGGGRGGTLRREARTGFAGDVTAALRAAGIDPDSAKGRQIAAEKLGDFDDQMRAARGRIGGPATRSERDRLGGFTNLGDTRLSGIRTGSGPSDDWKLHFGDRVQTSPANAPTAAPVDATAAPASGSAGGGSGDGLSGAANKLSNGAGAIDTAAAKLDAAGTEIQSSAGRLGAAADRLGNSADSLERQVRNLETRVSSLERNEGR